jgi:hypothetical protein
MIKNILQNSSVGDSSFPHPTDVHSLLSLENLNLLSRPIKDGVQFKMFVDI